jgi:hypothetical protein
MAGYAQVIRVLAHTDYVGDLKPDTFSVADTMPPVMRARVFRAHDAKEDNVIIVLYTGNMQPTELTTTLDVVKAESVTGETLPINPLVITNGLIYLFAKVPENLIDTQTRAMAMLRATKRDNPSKTWAPALVTVFDCSKFEANSSGYRITRDQEMEFRIPFTVYDISGQFGNIDAIISRNLPDTVKTAVLFQTMIRRPQMFEDHITLDKPAKSLEELLFDYIIETGQPMLASQPFLARQHTMSLRFIKEPTWEGLLEKHKNNQSLDISPEKWAHASSGRLSIDVAESGGVILKCVFGDVDKWCYPRMALPEGIDLTKYSGVILRGRAWGETTPRFFLHERDSGAGYMTEASLFPADGEWHAVRILFDRLNYNGSTPIDPNGRLDLENVKSLSIGFNTQSAEAMLEISDCILIQP